jgi:hypothetical protein
MKSVNLLGALLIISTIAFGADPFVASAAGLPNQNNAISYWTTERMASAQSREFVFAIGASRASLVSAPPFSAAGKGPRSTPTPSPTPTPTPTTPSGALSPTTGTSWNTGGLALSATGKVFFTMNGKNYVCSGAVVTDTRLDYSLVLTAGHCAYDQTARLFATNWLFVPAYDLTPNPSSCSVTVYGCWTASALVVHSGFAGAGGFTSAATTRDWAFAVIGSGGKSNSQLDVTVGSFPLTTTSLSTGWTAVAFGYPAAAPYNGQDLIYCAGAAGQDSSNANLTWSLPCTMTGGSSGGPWMSGFSVDRGALSSVNSYRYSGSTNMYGPKFNTYTTSTLNAANGATTNTIVQ